MRLRACSRIWVAYSGGMDSHVLLHVLSRQPASRLPHLRAVHVHHGLHPAADQWEAHCLEVCQHLRVPLSVIRIEARKSPGDSTEAWARDQRYQALAALLHSREEAVLTAHHQADQAETVLLQMLRGAGPDGLAAMPEIRALGEGRLIRPLLPFERQQLHRYAERHKLHWVEDSSNRDQALTRNYLRHRVMPLLRAHWPGADRCLVRVAGHQSGLRRLVWEAAATDIKDCTAADGSLRLAAWRQLPDHRADGVLRLWLKQQHWPTLPQRLVEEIRSHVAAARADRNPCLAWRGYVLRRYKQRFFSVTPLAPPVMLEWDMEHPLSLSLGVLQAGRIKGGGISAATVSNKRLHVRFRQGGERLAGSHTLKRYLSDQSVFPWIRHHLPLIYSGEQLIQIPGLWLADNCTASGDDYGWHISWRSPPYLRPDP